MTSAARRRLARAWERGVTLRAVRRHVAMALDQVWVRGGHHLGRGLRRRGHVIEPFDGSVRFALVVVNHSTTKYLKMLLLTLVEQSALGVVHRIVVVDNGSVDDGLPFLHRLAGRSPRVELVERHRLLHHANGLRAGVSHLRAVEHDVGPAGRCNVYLFCDPDVIFRSADALRELSSTILAADAGLVGEWRGDPSDPDIQASFLAVRSDAYAHSDVVPPVHHGSPTRWLQRSIVLAGIGVAPFASNHGGFILHRGRSAGRHKVPHYMGVPDGASVWTAVETRLAPLLEPDAEAALLDLLVDRFGALGTGLELAVPVDPSPMSPEAGSLDLHVPLEWSPCVLQRHSFDAVLVLRPPGEPLRLSGLAAVLWSMFENPAAPADVATAVVDTFAVDPVTARNDVAGFAHSLVAHGALDRVGAHGRRADPGGSPEG